MAVRLSVLKVNGTGSALYTISDFGINMLRHQVLLPQCKLLLSLSIDCSIMLFLSISTSIFQIVSMLNIEQNKFYL